MSQIRKKALADVVAERLRYDYAASASARLPSRKTLALHYGISEATLAKSMKKLAAQGFLQLHQGRRARLTAAAAAVDGGASPPRSQRSSAGILEEAIEHDIDAMVFKVGRSLPKVHYYVTTMHVTPRTVLQAYGRLVQKGRIHRVGKRYVVGAPRVASTKDDRIHEIVIVLEHANTWQTFLAPRTASFVQSFSSEAQQRGIRLRPVIADRQRGRLGIIAGFDAIMAHIHKLQWAYRGTLIPLPIAKMPNIERWIHALCQTDRPVVWFDKSGARGGVKIADKRYFRSCFSESAAILEALRHLADKGHENVWYPYSGKVSWESNRGVLLRRNAQAFGIRFFRRNIDFFDYYEGLPAFERNFELVERNAETSIQRKLRAFKAAAPDLSRKIKRFVKKGAPLALSNFVAELLEYDAYQNYVSYIAAILNFDKVTKVLRFLKENDVTAVVAPSDKYIRALTSNFFLAGLKIPEHISMLSFDNSEPSFMTQISSVDFGFGGMGYWSLHALIGDISIPLDTGRMIRATPFVNNLGSVARARPGALAKGIPEWLGC